MENKPALTPKDLFSTDKVKAKFQELLGSRAQGFITSVLQVIADPKFKDVDPNSVYHAAATAATLDLPINNNLGFAYIVPYKQWVDAGNGNMKQVPVAQFQMGYKGFIQLAQRSGQFKTISAAPIYEGQLVEENPLTGFIFDFTKRPSEGTKIIGYAAYFSLINGFEKTFFMPIENITGHAKKYSQSYKKEATGIWKDDFDGMAIKTVLKLVLSKYAPLSIEMQRGVITDQSVVKDSETLDVEYVDNQTQELPEIDKELERKVLLLQDCASVKEVQSLQVNPAHKDWPAELFTERIGAIRQTAREKVIELGKQKVGLDPNSEQYGFIQQEIEELERNAK